MARRSLQHPVLLGLLTAAGAVTGSMSKRREEEREAVRKQQEADAQTQRQMAMSTYQQQLQADERNRSYNQDLLQTTYAAQLPKNPVAAGAAARAMPAVGASPEVALALETGAGNQYLDQINQRGAFAPKPSEQADAEAQRQRAVFQALTEKGEWEQALGVLKGVLDPKVKQELAEAGTTYWMGAENFTKAEEWAAAGGDRQTLQWVRTEKDGVKQAKRVDAETSRKEELEQAKTAWKQKVEAVPAAQRTLKRWQELWTEAVQLGIAGDPVIRPYRETYEEQWTATEDSTRAAARDAVLSMPQNKGLADSLQATRVPPTPGQQLQGRVDTLTNNYLAASNMQPQGPPVPDNLSEVQQQVFASRAGGPTVPPPDATDNVAPALFPGTAPPPPTQPAGVSAAATSMGPKTRQTIELMIANGEATNAQEAIDEMLRDGVDISQ